MWADPSKSDPIGLGLRDTRVLFAPKVAICRGFELENATIDVSAEEVARINGRIILNANRQVYARSDEFDYLLQHNPGQKRGSQLRDDELAKEGWPIS
jgi:hypothetical protein